MALGQRCDFGTGGLHRTTHAGPGGTVHARVQCLVEHAVGVALACDTRVGKISTCHDVVWTLSERAMKQAQQTLVKALESVDIVGAALGEEIADQLLRVLVARRDIGWTSVSRKEQ